MSDALGDFQTPPDLAARIWGVLDTTDVDLIVEPTVGKGVFLATAPEVGTRTPWVAFDINPEYVIASQVIAAQRGFAAQIECVDAFGLTSHAFDAAGKTVLAVGNPPWITNAGQGRLHLTNLPAKHNRSGLTGLDAMTGKSNFDLAEVVLLRLVDCLRYAREIRLAFLVKRSVALKLGCSSFASLGVIDASFAAIDARRWFGASVEAGLLQLTLRPHARETTPVMRLHPAIGQPASSEAGVVAGRFVLDIVAYERGRIVEAAAGEGYVWRQGIKHDAARVLEFTRDSSGVLVNGSGEAVTVEQECLHPFYKSSDVAKGRPASRWFPLYQHNLGGPVDELQSQWPKLFAYLARHREQLGARGSAIYRGKPEFMLFGVGEYTLAPWKVVISGFYKQPTFRVLGPDENGRSPLVDDTCYLLPFPSEEEAQATAEYLRSADVQALISAVADTTAKRPFTKDVLARIARSNRSADSQLRLDLAS